MTSTADLPSVSDPHVRGELASADAGAPTELGPSDRRRASGLAGLVLVAVLAVTAVAALTSRSLYNDNETRLLNGRVHELGLVLAGAVPTIQTPLASAGALATATNGDPQKTSTPLDLEDLMDMLVRDLAFDGNDDTAIVGIRWRR
jgi:hypothetical protein